jgi:two-component sensor histidine kinase
MMNFYTVAWALISFSIFNGLALLWLGLIMFLAAEKREYGLWLVLLGIGAGGLFFLSHTMILIDQLTLSVSIWEEAWWRIGWLPVIAAPLLWYMMVLWYVGIGSDNSKALHWHKFSRAVLVLVALSLIALHLFAHPIPSFEQISLLDFRDTLSWRGIPLMLILFPPYAVLCVLLPLHAIQHPAPPRRMMADIARQRARPWLMISSLLLSLVAVIVSVFIFLMILPLPSLQYVREISIFILPMLVLDLAITCLIAVVIIALGKAVVTYEIFTGKTLPRGGFVRQWIASLCFTAVISVFIGYSIVYRPALIYSMMTLAGLSVMTFALLSWQSFMARNETIASLRPFVSGQLLMQDIIATDEDAFSHAQSMFAAICKDFLNTQQAQISPLNFLAALVANPLIYPAERQAFLYAQPPSNKLTQLQPEASEGFRWLLPLWSERGMIGLLFLGDKQDNALYTEEEIQVAQAAAERILDTLAAEQIARSLMGIQRRRMVEQRVMDFQTRRTLHDETLPRIHAAILSLSSLKEEPAKEAIQSLSQVHKQISRLIHSNPILSEQETDDFFSKSQSAIQNEFSTEFERIDWHLSENLPKLDMLTADVLFAAMREIVRNAAVHGRGNNPQRPLNLAISASYSQCLKICIQDDGLGLNKSEYRGGTGSGLSLHSTLLALVGGSLQIETAEQGGTQVTVTI